MLMVDVVDVFDEFNNGVPHARAIDRFVRHFFEMGDAGALVLVGDSSEDNKLVEDESAPNFVPTHSWSDHIGALNQDEIITTDKQYVLLPGPGGVVDVYPDLIVGRIPVGSDPELQRVLLKTFKVRSTAFPAPKVQFHCRHRTASRAGDRSSRSGRSLPYPGSPAPTPRFATYRSTGRGGAGPG